MTLENARLLRDMKLYDETIKVLKQLITENPKSTMVYNELAFTYSLMKKYEEAITYLNATLHLEENNAYAHFLKGNCLLYLDRVKEAVEEFKKAIAIKPGVVYYNQLGLAYVELQEYDKAIECYENAYKIVPKNVYKNNIADVYLKMKNFEKAKEILLKILENESDYTIALSNLSECYTEFQNYEEALKYINKAIEKENENIIFYFLRGSLYQDHLKMPKEALNDFDKAYEISQRGINIGNVFNTNGKYNKLLEKVESERNKLKKVLSDVNRLELELDVLVDKIEDKEKKANVSESLKNLKKEKEKASENIGLADKINILENVRAESAKIKKGILDHDEAARESKDNKLEKLEISTTKISEGNFDENKDGQFDDILELKKEIMNLKKINNQHEVENFSLKNKINQLEEVNSNLMKEISTLKNISIN
jgi:tetratricopeptide (TPR) repeat protein